MHEALKTSRFIMIYYWIQRFDKRNQAKNIFLFFFFFSKKQQLKATESEWICNMSFDFSHLFEIPPLLVSCIVFICVHFRLRAYVNVTKTTTFVVCDMELCFFYSNALKWKRGKMARIYKQSMTMTKEKKDKYNMKQPHCSLII